MSDAIERYNRIVRKPEDGFSYILPPDEMKQDIEEIGQDHRIPRTAIARWVSRTYAETVTHELQENEKLSTPIAQSVSEKEMMERPIHYPSDFGLSLIPFPSDIGGNYLQDRIETVCYTSLAVPRPFDPQIFASGVGGGGNIGSGDVAGMGFHAYSSSPIGDINDLTTRRGGGSRGGFAFTTTPFSNGEPSSVQDGGLEFDLGDLGFTNGGWNPEGLKYQFRPKSLRLGGLRNGWKHRVFFARSRQVLYRNIYGQISEDEGIPNCPMVVVNGLGLLKGITSISCSEGLNTPRSMNISISSIQGRREGIVNVGDTVQVYLSPNNWANPPLIYTGYVSDIQETARSITLTCLDTLGYLSNEIVQSSKLISTSDGLAILKNLIAGSSVPIPIDSIIVESNVVVPNSLSVANKTILSACQSVLQFMNSAPKIHSLRAEKTGLINIRILQDLADSNLQPLRGGELTATGRTSKPLDFYPTYVEQDKGDLDFFNVVVVINETAGINFTYPNIGSVQYPTRPVQKIFTESSITNNIQAERFAKLMLSNIGRAKVRYSVDGIPSTFDIRVGDAMEFATTGISGIHRIMGVSWNMTVDSPPSMTLNVGRESPDLTKTLQLALELSN